MYKMVHMGRVRVLNVLAEAALIVFSILLALYTNHWREERVAHQRLETALAEIRQSQEKIDRRMAEIDVFHSRFDGALSELKRDRKRPDAPPIDHTLRRMVFLLSLVSGASMLIGIIANALRLDPIRGLIYAAVANGLVAPVVMFFILRISGRMRHFPTHPALSALGWLVTGLMVISGIAAIATLVV